MVEGKNYTQIALELGMDRKTLYRLRQSISYNQFLNDLLDIHFQDMAELSKEPRHRLEAMKERGRTIRAGVVKQVHSRTETAEIKIHLHEFKKTPEE